MIQNNTHKYSVSAMCLVLKIPRSTYYYDATRMEKEEPFTDLVVQIFRESRNNYGARRIKAALRKKGYHLSRRRIRRIMKENGLVSNYTVAQYKVHTGKTRETTIPNRLNRQFSDHAPYAAIVSDLTYVRAGGKWHYICILADLYNREIVGYSAGPHKTAALVLEALSKVKGNLNQVQLFHTDRGSEFNNRVMAEALRVFNIQPSMSMKGCPYDNAVSEATFKTFKIEFIYQHQFDDLSHLLRELADYINWFNRWRLHSTLGYNSPLEYKSLYLHNPPSQPVESL